MARLRVAMAQVNATVGDLEGNARKILEWVDRARDLEADIICFPEMVLTGYPPEDLLLKPSFIRENRRWLQHLASKIQGILAVVGFVDQDEDIFNAAAVIQGGGVRHVYHKILLPNYGVFDERRYFREGRSCGLYRLGPLTLGVNICEDIWYPEGPTLTQARQGAQIILNINASPYHAGKGAFRQRMLATRAADHGVYLIYTNLVGGQDELLFDGQSMVFTPEGELLARGPAFEEALIAVDLEPRAVDRVRLRDPRWRGILGKEGRLFPVEEVVLEAPRLDRPRPPLSPVQPQSLEPEAEIYQGLVLGTRDYVRKNGFQGVVIALSGGIDSSLTAVIAVDALGPEAVWGVFMPSPYTSPESREDVEELVRRLGIPWVTLPITEIFQTYREVLRPVFEGQPEDVTEENLQARIRGNLIMALSNKFRRLVLTTGNKSEMSVGYATLYGDMAGGFAVIKDVLKGRVYALARWRNRQSEPPPIPERILTKAPSAELRPSQKDTDTLPPYEVLDPILEAYVEEACSLEEMVSRGFDPAVVRRVIRMVDRSEYKRRQAPPGIKITPRAFGKDWRVPITHRYRENQQEEGPASGGIQ